MGHDWTLSDTSTKKAPDIKGNTLRVYLFLAQNGASELRDVQRGLGFSTASLASYHLGRLAEGGVVTQDQYGRYLVAKDSPQQILAGYVSVGPRIVPQLLFFAVLFTLLVGYFAYMSLSYPDYVPYLVASALGLVAVTWYETARLWKRLASWR